MTVIVHINIEGARMYMDARTEEYRETVFREVKGRESKYYQNTGWHSDWEEVTEGTEGGFFVGIVLSEADINFSRKGVNHLDWPDLLSALFDTAQLAFKVYLVAYISYAVIDNAAALIYYLCTFGKEGFRYYFTLGTQYYPGISSTYDLLEQDIKDGSSGLIDQYGEGGLDSVPDIGFNSFDELKNAIGSPGEGNVWHHIVEQSQIEKSGFSSNQVQNVNNVISIPHGKGSVHEKISGFYSSKPDFTNGLTVRQWLSGKSFEEQFEFGMDVLRRYGIVINTNTGWVFTPFN